jgi:UDP-N-acetylglucosamine:LPS N-acetylglucosamine transferase
MGENEEIGKKLKVCFAASSGGHYEQLMMLKPLMEKYDSFVLTEKTVYDSSCKDEKTYYLRQVNRKEVFFFITLLLNAIDSFKIYLKERPDIIVCTGVLAMIPMCMIMKVFGKELIYIESFAKVTSATETGKVMYKLADRFFVQWESMKSIFPDATYVGGIY